MKFHGSYHTLLIVHIHLHLSVIFFSSPSLTPLMRCKRVFTSLNVIAVKELACIADAVFAPVRLGVVYPSAPFTLLSFVSDASLACDDLFSVLPLPSRTGTENSRAHHVRFENAPPEREEEPSQSDRAEEVEMDVGIIIIIMQMLRLLQAQ